MDTPSLQKLLDDIKAEIAAGNKILAIKLYRDATGAGLAEAKQAVELLAAGKPPPTGAAPSLSADAMREVRALLIAGKKIEAVKVYRTAMGVDLKDAKDVVDGLEHELDPDADMVREAPTGRARRLAAIVALIVVGLALLLYLLSLRGV